jgi:FixJ family two-component response regulator
MHAALSPREREAMAVVVTGMLNKQVAGELGISEITSALASDMPAKCPWVDYCR